MCLRKIALARNLSTYRLNHKKKNLMTLLEPCPFCGGEAGYVRYGDRRQSSIVSCSDCGARVEANEEGDFNGSAWNRRHLPKVDPPPLSQESQQDLETQLKPIQERKESAAWPVRTFTLVLLALLFLSALQLGLWFWVIYFGR
jgi:Lar family restriction alleviation protein